MLHTILSDMSPEARHQHLKKETDDVHQQMQQLSNKMTHTNVNEFLVGGKLKEYFDILIFLEDEAKIIMRDIEDYMEEIPEASDEFRQRTKEMFPYIKKIEQVHQYYTKWSQLANNLAQHFREIADEKPGHERYV